jgi:uncharacterized protein (TIGR02678 family)
VRAREISPLMLESYQRAARVILANHLVTTTYPDPLALPLLRRWTTELRDDLLELFGYRLEVTETTARLFTAADRLDPTAPATSGDRAFDRRRYAYLALALAALGRAGNQITLSELADHVAAEATQVPTVDLSTERFTDRSALVDAIGWLTARGAIRLADGDATGWASNPDAGEALYDIDRSVVIALFRPPRALQHLTSVRGLLTVVDETATTRETARRVRRALVQHPVVYADDLDEDERLQLALPRTAADVAMLTGLVVERRAEGIALIDQSGRLSDIRFPSTGTIAQVALLLAGEIADRVQDPDAPDPMRIPLPNNRTDDLVAQLDSAIPRSPGPRHASTHRRRRRRSIRSSRTAGSTLSSPSSDCGSAARSPRSGRRIPLDCAGARSTCSTRNASSARSRAASWCSRRWRAIAVSSSPSANESPNWTCRPSS